MRKDMTCEGFVAIIFILLLSELVLFVSSYGYAQLLFKLRRNKIALSKHQTESMVVNELTSIISRISGSMLLLVLLGECILSNGRTDLKIFTTSLFILGGVGACCSVYFLITTTFQWLYKRFTA